MNPYWGKDFFQVIGLFFQRFYLLLTGELSPQSLASDEVQIVVLVLLGISTAFLGTFLVLRKMTMLANSLSHTILLGIVISYLLTRETSSGLFLNLKILTIAALITGLLTTLCTEFLIKVVKLQEDASIGLVFTVFFALGIVLITLYTRNLHIGLEAIMGNIDALHLEDIKIIFYLALFNLVFFLLFYKRYEISTFDSTFARGFGIPLSLFNYLLMILTAATAIAAFRVVGVFLFLALLVGPVLMARMQTHKMSHLIFRSFCITSIVSLFSVALSRHFLTAYNIPLSTSGLFVTILSILYLLQISITLTIRRCKC